MAGAYRIEERSPTEEEYRRICEVVGWGSYVNFEAAPIALANSLYSVVAINQGEVVGMGRLVGDGAIFFYIQDVAVLPAFQGQGIGRSILEALLNYLRQHAPDKACLGLFASQGAKAFYRKYGFEPGNGMFQYIDKKQES